MTKSIIFFHPSSDLYGSDKILLYIMKNFTSYNKTLIIPSDGPLCKLVAAELPEVKIEIIKNYPLIAKKNLKLTGILAFLYSLVSFPFKIRKYNADIIYLNTLAVCPILFYFPKKNKIVHVHEILKNDKIAHKVINKIALKFGNLIICVSEAVKNNLKNINTKDNNKLTVVQNGINFKLTLDTNYAFTVDTTKVNLALIGRIKPDSKGQILLLDAINNLDDQCLKNSHFYIIGSTVLGQEYMLDEVMAKITEYKLMNNVTIIPFIEQIEFAYKMIDIIIVPSLCDDSFPTTILEGMFFSKPVIGSRVGGIPEMIEDGITGYVTDRGDASALSDKIKYFIENPQQIKIMGNNGKVRFTQHFSENSFHARFQQMIHNHIDI